MFIATSIVQISTEECNSLKEKRSVIKGIIESVHAKFKISVSEIADNDKWHKGVLGLAVVTNEKRFSEEVMSNVISFIERRFPGRISDYDLEIYSR